jgi:hypothetical protein
LGYRHAKEEMKKMKPQRTPRTTAGRVFYSNLTTPGVSFEAALRCRTEEQPQTHRVGVGRPATMEPMVSAALPQHEQQTTGQSVRAPNVNSLPLDKMLKVVVTAVQRVMTKFNGAVLEEANIVAVTKIVLNVMEQNGH